MDFRAVSNVVLIGGSVESSTRVAEQRGRYVQKQAEKIEETATKAG